MPIEKRYELSYHSRAYLLYVVRKCLIARFSDKGNASIYALTIFLMEILAFVIECSPKLTNFD